MHRIGGYSATTNVTHTAAVTPTNNKMGGPVGVAKVDSQATIPTPTYLQALSHGFTAAALPVVMDEAGIWKIPLSGFIGIGALTAVTGFGFLCWMEEPIK